MTSLLSAITAPAPCGYCRRCALHDDPAGCLTVEAWERANPEAAAASIAAAEAAAAEAKARLNAARQRQFAKGRRLYRMGYGA